MTSFDQTEPEAKAKLSDFYQSSSYEERARHIIADYDRCNSFFPTKLTTTYLKNLDADLKKLYVEIYKHLEASDSTREALRVKSVTALKCPDQRKSRTVTKALFVGAVLAVADPGQVGLRCLFAAAATTATVCITSAQKALDNRRKNALIKETLNLVAATHKRDQSAKEAVKALWQSLPEQMSELGLDRLTVAPVQRLSFTEAKVTKYPSEHFPCLAVKNPYPPEVAAKSRAQLTIVL